MSSVGTRAGAVFLASLFFISTFAISGFVLWEINRSDDATIGAEQTQNESQQAQESSKGKPMQDFTPITTQVTELQKTDLVEGTGKEAIAGATITVHYTGALAATGAIFESSKDGGQPATFPLSGLIKGWQDGIPGMKEGGKRRLVIPYAQAYGEAGNPPTIPAKSDLVFDIELISVQ